MNSVLSWTGSLRCLGVAAMVVSLACSGQGDIGLPSPGPTSNYPVAALPSAGAPVVGAEAGSSGALTEVPSITTEGGAAATQPGAAPSARSMNMTPDKPPRLTGDHRGAFPTDAEVTAKRNELIAFLWGSDGFPSTKLPSSVDKNVASPVAGLGNVERVDTLHIQMDAGMVSLAHHFIPAQGKKNRLVIVHQGHASSLNDDPSLDDVEYGLQRTINNLLADGYSVMAMYMPGCLPPSPACDIDHKTIVDTPTTGSGMKFFLEPVATALNYVETQSKADDFPIYKDFSMVGLSGGGWTTTVYAALDPRIKLSVPVAGSLPLSLRSGSSVGDEEQTHADFYDIAGYTDLYVLGGYGLERRQVQVLIRHDNCCFGESLGEYDATQTGKSYDDAVRGYELEVRQRLQQLKVGSFRLEIDDAAPGHMISWNTIATIVLSELAGGKRASWVGADQKFERGDDGSLVRSGPGSIENTALAMVGVPAVTGRPDGSYDVFFRDPKNILTHAFNTGGLWTQEPLGTLVMTDPVLSASGPERVDVAALTVDYLPHHWRADVGTMASDVIGVAPRAFGPPLLSSTADGQVDIFLRGWDRTAYRLHDDGTSNWIEQIINQMPVLSTGFPSSRR